MSLAKDDFIKKSQDEYKYLMNNKFDKSIIETLKVIIGNMKPANAKYISEVSCESGVQITTSEVNLILYSNQDIFIKKFNGDTHPVWSIIKKDSPPKIIKSHEINGNNEINKIPHMVEKKNGYLDIAKKPISLEVCPLQTCNIHILPSQKPPIKNVLFKPIIYLMVNVDKCRCIMDNLTINPIYRNQELKYHLQIYPFSKTFPLKSYKSVDESIICANTFPCEEYIEIDMAMYAPTIYLNTNINKNDMMFIIAGDEKNPLLARINEMINTVVGIKSYYVSQWMEVYKIINNKE